MLLLLVLLLGAVSAEASLHAPDPPFSGEVAKFLSSLTPAQRKETALPFSDPERLNWDWTPGARAGLSLKKMSDMQRVRARELISRLLSPQGNDLVDSILSREAILARIESNRSRDPQLYYLAVFGNPGNGGWGLRFEGHHLSLNFTFHGETLIGVTPLVVGANPATWRPETGEASRLLGAEVDLAWNLFLSLHRRQKHEAYLGRSLAMDTRWGNFLLALNPGPKASGARGDTLSPGQRAILRKLIEHHVGWVREDFAAAYLAERADVRGLHFYWRGGEEPGTGYIWGIRGPNLIIEHNAAQDAGNHIHAVWRDDALDFGREPLSQQ